MIEPFLFTECVQNFQCFHVLFHEKIQGGIEFYICSTMDNICTARQVASIKIRNVLFHNCDSGANLDSLEQSMFCNLLLEPVIRGSPLLFTNADTDLFVGKQQ